MFNRIENPFNKPEISNSPSLLHYTDAVKNLLEGLNDKDDQVKGVCEASLIRIANRHPNDIINFIIAYKKKTPKISDKETAVILR
jgi:hypothetical protein